MVATLWGFLVFIITITIPICAANNVELIPRYSSSFMNIICQAVDPDASSFMIHLKCPLVKSGFCFSNCTRSCTSTDGADCANLNAISQCQYNIISGNKISTSYKINTSRVSITGDWSCSFKNYKSNSVSLAKYEFPKTTTSAYHDLKPVHVGQETVGKNTFISTETTVQVGDRSPKNIKVPKTTKITNEYNILHYVTRPELVLILIILLGISLLLNLSFLIRCVLLKSVIENYYRGIPNSECIVECLCLDLGSNKNHHSRYPQNLNTQNGTTNEFYRCQPLYPDNMAVYDDLSAASNTSARMKLRSNNSSEIDDESHMTTLLPNGGYHINQLGGSSRSGSLTRRFINPNHAAYFHPGLGNYVIVSGPVASHDQYSPITLPSGYSIQMVSPIPSATGSMERGPPIGNQASSIHSDESDNDSRTPLSSSMGNALQYRSVQINSQPNNQIDERKVDQTQNAALPGNGFNRPLVYQHENNNHLYRSNGSVPLHSCSKERIMPTTSSIPSIPFYTLSENSVFNKELKNSNMGEKVPSKEADLFQL